MAETTSETGYSGTSLAQKLDLKDGQRALWCGFVLALGTLHAAAETIKPVSERELIGLIRGCWEQRHSADSFSSICFDADGTVLLLGFGDAEALMNSARFEIVDRKLHIEGSGDVWPFERALVDCSVVVQPLVELKLYQCEGSGEFVGGEVGKPPVSSVRDQSWTYASKLEDCDWCEL